MVPVVATNPAGAIQLLQAIARGTRGRCASRRGRACSTQNTMQVLT